MRLILLAFARWRDERLPTLALAGLVFATAFVFAIAPRLLTAVADDALQDAIGAADPVARNVQLIEERRINPDARSALHGPEVIGERRRGQLPATVQELFADRSMLIETPRWSVAEGTHVASTVRMIIQPGAEGRLRLVDGRLPTGETRLERVTWPELADPVAVRFLEAAMSVESAQALRIGIGTTLLVAADPSDRLAAGHHEERAAIVVVGTFEISNPADAFWFGDTSLVRPYLRLISPEVGYYDATALMSPDAYAPLMETTSETELPMRYIWRFEVDALRLTADRLSDLVVDVRRMENVFPASPLGPGARDQTLLRTNLLRLLEAQRSEWRSAQAVLSVVGIGPAVVAVAALSLVSLLASRRRRAVLGLWRTRGASAVQILAAIVVEGVFVAVPASLLAAVTAVRLLPAGASEPAALAGAAVAFVAIALLVAVSRPPAEGPAGAEDRLGSVVRRPSPRRLVFEGLVVVLAVAGTILLRDRGVQGVSSAGDLEAADPFIAAVPALAGLAAGLVAVRLFPLPMGLLAALAALRRDLVPVLAIRRTTRGSGTTPVLLVLLGTATVGAFSLATLGHLSRAADAVAWHDTGAAFRVTIATDRLPDTFEPAGLAGVEAAAAAYRADTPLGARGARVDLLALEAGRYDVVVEGTAADPRLPQALLSTQAGAVVPAIVSPGIGSGDDALDLGDRFDLTVDGRRHAFEVVEVRSEFPTIPVGDAFVVASRDHLDALREANALPVTEAFLRAPESTERDIRSALARAAPGAVLESRTARSEAVRTAPVVEAVSIGVAAAAIVAGAYAALAVAAALALAGAARAIELAHLRTLGLSRREAAALAVVEHGPTVVLALAAGVALGLALFVLLLPGLGLAALVDSQLAIPLAVEPVHLALLLVATVIIMGAGMALAALVQRRVAPAAAIRRGIE